MGDFRLPPLDAAERVYRALLHLYPPRFRRAFAQDLIETFRDERRDARERGMPAGAFWLATLHDLLLHGCAERASTTWRTLRRFGRYDGGETAMAGIPVALRAPELRYAARRLARVPTFTAATVLVLALGIGATTAVFSIVNGVLLRPLPYPDAERLVHLGHTVAVGGVNAIDQSDGTFLLYQRHAKSIQGIGAARERDVNLGATEGEGAERLSVAAVSASLFPVLGVAPALGRGFRDGEDRVGAPAVAALSHALWERRFGGDPAVIGRKVIVDGVSREIVALMPRGFGYPSSGTELWYPEPFNPATASPASFNYLGVARLRPGTTTEGLRAELNGLLPRLLDEFPAPIPREMWEEAKLRATVKPLRDAIVGDVSRLLWILLGSVALVLLIACANVANLFLVRGESRQRELAVRGALGAGLAGIVAQCLSESLLLAASGGVLGVALAAAGVRLATRLGPNLGVPRLEEISIDGTVLLFALGISLFCAVAVSLIPLLRARRMPIASVLRESGRSSTEGGSRQRARSALVVAQIALALILVATSGLFARSFARLRDVKPGFDAGGITMARVALPNANYPGATPMRLYAQLLERVRAIPGVRDATITDWVPLTADHNDSVLGVEDQPLPPNGVPRVHYLPAADGAYFRTMHIPLVAGRTFGEQDPARPAREVIVSEAFAKRYWPNGSPLGRRVRPGISGPWWTIVGVVGDVHLTALDQPAEDAVYFPLVRAGDGSVADSSAYTPRRVALLVRTASPSVTVTPAIRDALRALDPSVPIYDERPLGDVVEAASARARVTLLLLGIASTLALILGAVGIYGVMAYGVSLRRREIGVRLALGARPADVRDMISRQGIALGAVGVTIGVVCALGVTRLLRGLLYDVSPTDPMILTLTCVALLGVSLVASWIPARRAAATDPAVALRGE